MAARHSSGRVKTLAKAAYESSVKEHDIQDFQKVLDASHAWLESQVKDLQPHAFTIAALDILYTDLVKARFKIPVASFEWQQLVSLQIATGDAVRNTEKPKQKLQRKLPKISWSLRKAKLNFKHFCESTLRPPLQCSWEKWQQESMQSLP